ncbi:ImmA/IrrE family metallo-endopeptidase [Pseudoclostridium thermosuccinogenes]|jgi:Zn-dependent peptidase ImmA (M78 family)|uniref:ImmA/IrrE family metallo-endopeptidase n=1 Tax=Clostridium thermosuccinogenes TaxID=84032 RepID=UPI000CCBD82F|nr:ImmA/IrrE family metallo-endopeptidase [Pseudoclostridium thermosuccinogenes]PNT90900.1 hypothetical protein CDQ83_13750 [Pseudoclostridium thermosuccinogenes]
MAISKARQEFIRFQVNLLRKRLKIKRYPIIMQKLILQEFHNKCLLRYLYLSDSIDAVSVVDPKSNLCVIIVNANKVKKHLLKRLNFSLAHELGHYILGHHRYFSNNITSEKVADLEEEANEFAGLLLVNESKLRQNKRVDSAQLSDYFFVSKEVIKIRKQKTPTDVRALVNRYYI